MTDFAVEFKVRNGRIRRAMREAGYPTVNKFCKANGLQPAAVGDLLNLKKSPMTQKGLWRATVVQMANALDCVPDDLFSPVQRTMQLKTNAGVKEVSESQMLALAAQDRSLEWDLLGAGDPLALLEVQEQEAGPTEKLLDMLEKESGSELTRRERHVLILHFDGEIDHAEIAARLDVSYERARQIEAKAIRKIKRALEAAKDSQRIQALCPPGGLAAVLDELEQARQRKAAYDAAQAAEREAEQAAREAEAREAYAVIAERNAARRLARAQAKIDTPDAPLEPIRWGDPERTKFLPDRTIHIRPRPATPVRKVTCEHCAGTGWRDGIRPTEWTDAKGYDRPRCAECDGYGYKVFA